MNIPISFGVLTDAMDIKPINRAGGTSGGSDKTLFELAGENVGSNSISTMDPIDNAFEQWKEKVLRDIKTLVANNI